MQREEEEKGEETKANEEIMSDTDELVSIDKLFKYFEQKEDFNEDDLIHKLK